MNYWMLTISVENFAVTRQQGYKVQGFTDLQRRKTDRMQPGDRLLFYIKEPRGFGLTATITSRSFKEQSSLWHHHWPKEIFPHRVRIKSEAALQEGKYVEATEIAPRLEYIRRWPPERWPLAFLGELHLLPRRDFELIEGEIRRIVGRPKGKARFPKDPGLKPQREQGAQEAEVAESTDPLSS